jgi:hypothetical protein
MGIHGDGGFASPSAHAAAVPAQPWASLDILSPIVNGFSVWSALLTLLLAAVVYDQCMSPLRAAGSARAALGIGNGGTG